VALTETTPARPASSWPPPRVRDGVPVPPPDDDPAQTGTARTGASSWALLALAAVLFALGWAAGVIGRVLSWAWAALALGYDSGRGR
jgi:hypothetical protein